MLSPRNNRVLALALRPFAQVRPNEAVGASVLMVGSFLLLSAYYLLKTVREPLILLHGGAEVKLYARAGQAVLMVGVVHVYGEIAKRVGRMKLLGIVFPFFISNLVVFAFLARASVSSAWRSSSGWGSSAIRAWRSSGASRPTSTARNRASASSRSSGSAARSARSPARGWPSPSCLRPLRADGRAAVLLVVCIALLAWVETRLRRRCAPRGRRPQDEEPLSDEGALHLLLRDRYLLLIAAMIVLLNWCNSAGEYVFDRALLAAVRAARDRGTGAGGVHRRGQGRLLRLVQPPRDAAAALRRLAHPGQVRRSQRAAVPAGVRVPRLRVCRRRPRPRGHPPGQDRRELARVLHRRDVAARALPGHGRVEKYVGKTSVDTIAVRVGAILSGAVVWIGSKVGAPVQLFATVNVILTAVWIGVVLAIGRENARRRGVVAPTAVPVPVPA